MIPEALATCKLGIFFDGVRFYLTVYENGCSCTDVDNRVKLYKSQKGFFCVAYA